MSAISKTQNRGHNTLEVANTLPNVSFKAKASETESDYYEQKWEIQVDQRDDKQRKT